MPLESYVVPSAPSSSASSSFVTDVNKSAWDLLPRIPPPKPAWIPRSWSPREPYLGPTLFEQKCLDPVSRADSTTAYHCSQLERHIACARYAGSDSKLSKKICGSYYSGAGGNDDEWHRQYHCVKLIETSVSHSDVVSAVAEFDRALAAK